MNSSVDDRGCTITNRFRAESPSRNPSHSSNLAYGRHPPSQPGPFHWSGSTESICSTSWADSERARAHARSVSPATDSGPDLLHRGTRRTTVVRMGGTTMMRVLRRSVAVRGPRPDRVQRAPIRTTSECTDSRRRNEPGHHDQAELPHVPRHRRGWLGAPVHRERGPEQFRVRPDLLLRLHSDGLEDTVGHSVGWLGALLAAPDVRSWRDTKTGNQVTAINRYQPRSYVAAGFRVYWTNSQAHRCTRTCGTQCRPVWPTRARSTATPAAESTEPSTTRDGSRPRLGGHERQLRASRSFKVAIAGIGPGSTSLSNAR